MKVHTYVLIWSMRSVAKRPVSRTGNDGKARSRIVLPSQDEMHLRLRVEFMIATSGTAFLDCRLWQYNSTQEGGSYPNLAHAPDEYP